MAYENSGKDATDPLGKMQGTLPIARNLHRHVVRAKQIPDAPKLVHLFRLP